MTQHSSFRIPALASRSDLPDVTAPDGSEIRLLLDQRHHANAASMVEVNLPAEARLHSFRHDVMPVLSKGGCNAGACHGYSLGKNGFKLSLRGSDPGPDYESLTAEFLQRRVNRHNPPASLLVTKPLGDVPHEGGIRFEPGGLQHRTLLSWIARRLGKARGRGE